MTSPIDIVNLALDSIGAQNTISSFTEDSAEATVAARQYQVRLNGFLRAAHWSFARKTVSLTQLKTSVNQPVGTPANQLPPPPFLYEYAYPSDCLLARFILPAQQQSLVNPPFTTAPTTVLPDNLFGSFPRFTPGVDTDANGNQIKVILTNAFQAQLVYTSLVSNPDLWDSSFLEGFVATLGAWFVNPIARNRALLQDNIGIAKSILDNARAMNANEELPSYVHLPDWMSARGVGDFPEERAGQFADGFSNGWQPMAFPGGLAY